MQTDIKALAQNIDNELLENSALLASLMARHEAVETRFHATSADDTEDLLSGLAREMDSLEPKLNAVSSRIRALNGVYLAYNWNRAYIVSGGHVHNTPNRCPGLQAGTVTHMLPECSALTEAEVVELAGERACTHCYPSAPLSARQQASKLFAPDEEAKAERKIERQRKADEKEAREVRVPEGPSGPGRVFGTVRSARIEAANQLWWALYALVYNPNGTSPENREAVARNRVMIARDIMAAIAGHRDGGVASVDELEAELLIKARQKFIREGKAPEICKQWGMTPEEFTQRAKDAADKLASL